MAEVGASVSLDRMRSSGCLADNLPQIPEASDDEDDKENKRGNATELTSAQQDPTVRHQMCTQGHPGCCACFQVTQEHLTFGKFGDSLLTKSAKLEDLIASIEQEMVDRKDIPKETLKRAEKYHVSSDICEQS